MVVVCLGVGCGCVVMVVGGGYGIASEAAGAREQRVLVRPEQQHLPHTHPTHTSAKSPKHPLDLRPKRWPGDPDSFTRFRPYLAHFPPVFSRF
eukprot:COSAG04_NODE_16630_length_493_cov_1.104061_1_plen_92_part_10